MAKFCGKCGAKLDVTTGLCPNCDVDKLKKQSDKSEAVDVAKSIQEIAPTSEKPLSKKEAKKKRKADKKAAKKAKKKESFFFIGNLHFQFIGSIIADLVP